MLGHFEGAHPDQTADQVLRLFAAATRDRASFSGLCMHGAPSEPRFTVVCAARPLSQRLELAVEAARLPSLLARHARDGFHPAHVSMLGSERELRVSLVLEPAPPGSPLPRFLGPRPFRGEEGPLFFEGAQPIPDDLYLRSVAVAGAPTRTDGRDVLVAGAFWPQPSTRIAWAVHLDVHGPADGPWSTREEVLLLGGVARPVAVQSLASDSIALVASLWHDTRLAPWPEPDPLAPGARFSIEEGLDRAALALALERRQHAEGRPVLGVSAIDRGGPRFTALFGEPGVDAPLERRRRVTVDRGQAPRVIDLGDEPRSASDAAHHPLDRWMWDHMARTGARQAQLVVVRGPRLAHAAAYTFAEPGYPVATLEDAIRLGSVSKLFAALTLLGALEVQPHADGLDLTAAAALGLEAPEAPRLASVKLRHLLAHDAGLGSFPTLHPEEPTRTEDRLASLARGSRAVATPGDLSRALRAHPTDEPFLRSPGRGDAALTYSNDGYIWLGEIASFLATGREGDFETTLCDLVFRPVGIEPGSRGCCFARDRAGARDRGEAPAHPTSPTWRRVPSATGPGPLALASYADDGPFLGGAAGVSIPLLWVAQVARACGSATLDRAPFRAIDWARLAAPAAANAKRGHGVFLGEPSWWTFRAAAGYSSQARVHRAHHNGRIDGGSSLWVHQWPMDADADPDASLTVVAAFNQLGPLYEEPHGRELFAILRQLESTADWATRDGFAA